MADDNRPLASLGVLRSFGEDDDVGARAKAVLSRTLNELDLPSCPWRAQAATAGVCLFLLGFLLGFAAFAIQDHYGDVSRAMGPYIIGAGALGMALLRFYRPGVVRTDRGPLAIFLNDTRHPSSIIGEQGGAVVVNCRLPVMPRAEDKGRGVVGACRDLAFLLLDRLSPEQIGLESSVVNRAKARARALFALEAVVTEIEARGGQVHLGSRFAKWWALVSVGVSVATTVAFPSAAMFVGTFLAGVIVTVVASLRSGSSREMSLGGRRWSADDDLTEHRYEIRLRSPDDEIRVSVAMPTYEDLRSAESRIAVMGELGGQLEEGRPATGSSATG